MLETVLSQLADFLSIERLVAVAQSLILVILGLVAARVVAGALGRLSHDRLAPSQTVLLTRVARYTILGLFGAAALNHLGFNLGVLIGAAGILTVALGFASQTSASNFISGLFLIAEKPFTIGDVIQIEDVTGQVLSIDLLSLKLRTFDNILVRIPNETLIKSKTRTLTRFPIRRLDIPISVAYKEDLGHVRRVLFAVADRNPLSLDEPKPLLILQGFGDSGIDLQFSVWATRERYLELRNTVLEEIKETFDREAIEIPFPHRSLYAGTATEPLPIRLVESPEVSAAGSPETPAVT
jgi:small-conductance mechanosensitive channel